MATFERRPFVWLSAFESCFESVLTCEAAFLTSLRFRVLALRD